MSFLHLIFLILLWSALHGLFNTLPQHLIQKTPMFCWAFQRFALDICQVHLKWRSWTDEQTFFYSRDVFVLFGPQWFGSLNSLLDVIFAHVVLGSFVTSWMNCQCTLGVILVETPGLVHHCPNCVNDVVHQSRLPFSDLLTPIILFQLFMNFYKSRYDWKYYRLLHVVRQALFERFIYCPCPAVIRTLCCLWNRPKQMWLITFQCIIPGVAVEQILQTQRL